MRSTIAFGVGVIIGAGVAILLAPKIDEQIRKPLADKVTDGIERGQAKIHEITSRAIRVADQAKDQVHRVQDAVDAGVRAFKGIKNSTS